MFVCDLRQVWFSPGTLVSSTNKTDHHNITKIPYLGLHNEQDFAQIIHFAGGVRIINKNNVFHSFFRPENHM
jgi:hypothetical protein